MRKEVTLAMGNGGEESSELIEKIFFKYFKNEILSKGEDGRLLMLVARLQQVAIALQLALSFLMVEILEN